MHGPMNVKLKKESSQIFCM